MGGRRGISNLGPEERVEPSILFGHVAWWSRESRLPDRVQGAIGVIVGEFERLNARIAELESEVADLRRDHEAWEWLGNRPYLDVVCVVGSPLRERRYRVLDSAVTLDGKVLGEGPTPRDAVLAAMEGEKARDSDG